MAVSLLIVAAVAALGDGSGTADAGEVRLKSGFVIPGEPIERPGLTYELAKSRRRTGSGKFYPVWSIEDGVRRYFVPRGLVDRDAVSTDETSIGMETFEIDRFIRDETLTPQRVGVINQSTPFDSQGRRTLDLTTNRGSAEMTQAVAVVRPDYVVVETLDIDWQYGLLTSELSDDSLLGALNAVTDSGSKADRMSRIHFLIQAERYELARGQLLRLLEEFPDLSERVERFQEQLPRLYGRKAMRVVQTLKQAGRHAAASHYAGEFEPGVVADETLAAAESLIAEAERLAEDRDEILYSLATLEGELSAEEAAKVRPLRNVLEQELHVESMPRLRPFVRVIAAEDVDARGKLALAYSGWVLGADGASEDFTAALRLWQFRAALLDLLRSTDDYQFEERLAGVLELKEITAGNAVAAIRLLPAIRETAGLDAAAWGGDFVSAVAGDGTAYEIQLPPEYSAAHTYPAVLALHAGAMGPSDERQWWADGGPLGEAAKRGVIVIAPAWRGRVAPTPGEIERRVMAVLRDARSRVRIDSDRVFLGGHFEGGTAAVTVGFTRPDVWAGLVPVGGGCGPIARRAWENAIGLPVYAVYGGLDGGGLQSAAAALESLMLKRSEVVVAEYVGRGRESFAAERLRIFDWMALHARRPLTRDFERRVFTDAPQDDGMLRVGSNFELASGVLPPGTFRTIAARVMTGSRNRARVSTPQRPAELWLNDSIADLSERMSVEVGSRLVATDSPTASLEMAVRDFAARFDRERVFTARVRIE